MTRYARSGSTQKHKKMPGDATTWSEFSNQSTSSTKKMGIFKARKNKINFSKSGQSKVKRQNLNASNKKSIDNFASVKKEIESDSIPETQDNQNEKSSDNHVKLLKTHEIESVINENDNKEFSKNETTHMKKNEFKNRKNKNLKKSFASPKKERDLSSSIKKYSEPDLNNDESSSFNKETSYQQNSHKRKRSCFNCQKTDHLVANCPEKTSGWKESSYSKQFNKSDLTAVGSKHFNEEASHQPDFHKRKRTKKPCFNCRKTDHLLADCPEKTSGIAHLKTGICFKCGSVDHTSSKCQNQVEGYPFAKCFICKEQGHISRDCPQNTHGVYIKGGQCNNCGNVNHLKKDCPSLIKKESEEKLATAYTIKEGLSIDDEIMDKPRISKQSKTLKKPKIVKF